MKKRQFYTLLWVIILWFWIVIYQNYRALDYLRVLDLRQASIIKEIYSVEWNVSDIQDKLKPIRNELDSVMNILNINFK